MRFTELPRRVLFSLALLLAAVSVSYSALWMYYARWERKARLGVQPQYLRSEKVIRIAEVIPGAPAAAAGIRAGDRLVEINGRALDTANPFYDAVVRGQPGDEVELRVERPGEAAFRVRVRLAPLPAANDNPGFGEWLASELVNSYPVLFVVVGLPMLFLRLNDRNAWLLALLFAGLIAGAPLLLLEPVVHPGLRGFMLFYKILGVGLSPALFYFFFAVFPEASPLERRAPHLKWLLLIGSLLVAAPLAVWGLYAGSSAPLLRFANRVGGDTARTVIFSYFFGGMALGLASLVGSGLRAPSAETRRKLKVIVWGTVVGMVPFLLVFAAAVLTRRNYYDFPFWVWTPPVMLSFLIPLSMAYAVVKHRVLEVPVLLKRSARYLLVQRGFMLLMVVLLVAVTFRLARASSEAFGMQASVAAPVGILLGSALGILLAVGAGEVGKRITQRIDRAFFRSAYDARQILEDLAEKTRTATSREELATLLRRQIGDALYPKTRYVYLEDAQGRLAATASDVAPELGVLPREWPVLESLARYGRPWEVPPMDTEHLGGAQNPEDSGPRLPHAVGPLALDALGAFLQQIGGEPREQVTGTFQLEWLRSGAAPRLMQLEPECLVPLVGRNKRLVGLLVLGPRMSEEPYSGEDHRLLASVATHAATALEGIRLAEEIAERIESQRKATHEIEIAQKVQRRLLPQKQPKLETLEYVGLCIQARAVGGDYYDYLDLGPGRLGLVQADIAGKGISAALLMANLQANLRSQYAVALEDIPRLLRSVNRLFVENTEPAHYATAFFAVYDDAERRLRYENCGHNPPLLVRADGRVDRLQGSATVLGMFEPWECSLAETQLQPGDLLVIYSDGVSEAQSDDGDFFGEERLLEAIRAHQHLPVSELVETLARTVVTFSGREQEDDITLVVARGR